MQAGRWSVKNQCICFTNLHYQPWRHPVKWRRHWKTWMISWPTPQQTITTTTTTTKNTSKQKQQQTHTTTTTTTTNKQTTTTTKQKISTKTGNPNSKTTTTTSPPLSTYSTVLCFVLYVDCLPLFILWFSFCSFLFILLLWMRQTKLGLNGEKTSDVRWNKTKTDLRFHQLLPAWR